ncbi:hypothetical protein KAK07_24540 [Ideonella sp. 4Y16]|uniref:hypothetical protein n=1 Tax=Ideonella alba TaxID=2824118 RepID=UPI001B36F1DC|nr:hypothetical protein [Ideonella alba]MBQ0946523.1 hypothetical protein [Ideonella alba]
MDRLLRALAVCITLVGCGMPLTPEAFTSSPEALALRSIVDRLTQRDFASVEAQLDPALAQGGIRAALEKTANAIPSAPITKVEAVAWKVVVATGRPRTAAVAAEYTFGQKQWLVASAQLTGEPNAYRILSFNVEPLPAPMSQIHAFTLSGKGVTHYLFLVAAVAAVVVTLFALVRCARAKGLRRKWLWLIFIALGFVSFTINWSNGAVSINPLAFNLLSAAFMRQGWLGPWMLTFCVPVGAIWFLLRQRGAAQNVTTAG